MKAPLSPKKSGANPVTVKDGRVFGDPRRYGNDTLPEVKGCDLGCHPKKQRQIIFFNGKVTDTLPPPGLSPQLKPPKGPPKPSGCGGCFFNPENPNIK